MDVEVEIFELEGKFGPLKGPWEVGLEEEYMVLRYLKTGERYEINRSEVRKKVDFVRALSKDPFLSVKKPVKVAFQPTVEQTALLKEWIGPPTLGELKAALRLRLGWSLPAGIAFVMFSLPIKLSDDPPFVLMRMGWTGIVLGLFLIGMYIVMRFRPGRNFFLINSAWFVLGGLKILYHIIIYSLSWWYGLLILLFLMFILDGIGQYNKFDNVVEEKAF